MCGCGGDSGGSSAAGTTLLSGTLDSRYAPDTSGQSALPVESSSAAADITGGAFSSGGFWIVVFFIVGAAWYVDRHRKDRE